MSTDGLLFITSNCLVALVLAGLIFLLTAYFSLPVRSSAEGRRVARRMISSLFGKAAPVAFVKEGELSHPDEGKDHNSLKMALVDLTSAVVLDTPPARRSAKKRSRKAVPAEPITRSRVAGHGLVFVEAGESIRTVASLRSQVRRAAGIRCQSSDGVEFSASVYVVFSLVQPAAVIQVGYFGKKAEDLQVLQIDPQSGVVKSASDELDKQDKAEVFVFLRSRRNVQLPSTDLILDQPAQAIPPYLLDETVQRRVAAAAGYRPLNVQDQTRETWADLPLVEAIKVFRRLILSARYDDLFEATLASRYPLGEIYKPHFQAILRNQGILAYQLVQRIDGAPLAVGQRVDPATHLVFPVQEFTAHFPLRDLGIKVIEAGFSDLDPGQAIRQQQLQNWQAGWQRKAEMEKEKQEQELRQIKNQAREDTRRQVLSDLRQALQAPPGTEKEASVRLLQTLEAAAADPATRQLLSASTLALLRDLQQAIMPAQQPGGK